MIYYNKKQSCKPRRRIVTSATLPEIYNSLWQMSEKERVYFSRALTTSCKIYLWRHQASEHAAVCGFCAARLIISEWWHHQDNLIMITKSHALQTFHYDGRGKTHLTTQSVWCMSLPFREAIDSLNWLHMKETGHSREEACTQTCFSIMWSSFEQ